MSDNTLDSEQVEESIGTETGEERFEELIRERNLFRYRTTTPTFIPEGEYLASKEAADYLEISDQSLKALVKRGSITAYKVGGTWLYPVRELDRHRAKRKPRYVRWVPNKPGEPLGWTIIPWVDD